METEHQTRLTSAEISQIWMAYMNDSLSACVIKYFLNCVEDESIREIVQNGLDSSVENMGQLRPIFEKEGFPIPVGFKENKDVDVNGPRLFSDSYILNFMMNMAALGMSNYSFSLSLAVRDDVYEYFSKCFSESNRLHKIALDLMLEKGLYARSPYIPAPKKVDFVKKQSFLTGWFGHRRPLTGSEITNMYANILRNELGAATLIGFSQVAVSKDVKEFMVRGNGIAAKHVEVLGSIMGEDDLPVPANMNAEVTENTSYVFSDKLMMFFTSTLIAEGVGFYGLSMAASPRRDLEAQYTRLTAEVLQYAEDGANIMIDHGWMEQPPSASDRRELADG